MNTYRVLAALLTYPTEDLVSSLPSMRTVLEEEGILPEEHRQRLAELCDRLGTADLWDLQADYVELFDQSRSLSLHLYEHVHGESRDRGQAMVELQERYRGAGLELEAKELPDFLPVYLEYLSQLGPEAARSELRRVAARVAATLETRLGKRSSPYAAVMAAIGCLAGTAATPGAGEAEGAERSPDADWQEAPVDFSKPPETRAASPAAGRES